jgi:hypothetical protein
LHNLEAIKQLMESVRDEASADSRPSLRFWTALAIAFTMLVAYWQPVFSRYLEINAKTTDDVNIWCFTGLMVTGLVFLIFFFFLPPCFHGERGVKFI